MAYTKKDWKTGEVIFEEDLDHLETQYDEVKSELAKSGGDIAVNAANVRGTFSGDVEIGSDNQHVLKQRSATIRIDTRTLELIYDSQGNLVRVDEKDGSNVVKTTTLTYAPDGRPSQIQETAGGVTVTSTLIYDADGKLASVLKAVG